MKIRIYQINSERDINRVKFFGFDSLKKLQGTDTVDVGIYDEVYEGEVESSMLEGIYKIFNTAHPDGFTGHSLSVSDIVEVITSPGHPSPEPGFYFCDSIGFKKVAFDTELPQPANRGEILRLNAKTKMDGELPTIAARDAYLEELWKIFGDIPMDPETECIEEPFYVNPGDVSIGTDCFPKGTHREDIWHWFDERHSHGVAWLLYRNLEQRPMSNVLPKYFQRMKMCKACDSELCIFNPDGMCMYPLVTGSLAKIDDDGCHNCVCQDDTIAAVGNDSNELIIDLGAVDLVAQIDTSVKREGEETYEVDSIFVALRHKRTSLMQDIAMVRGNRQIFPQGYSTPKSIDCKVWTNELQEYPTHEFEVPVYLQPTLEKIIDSHADSEGNRYYTVELDTGFAVMVKVMDSGNTYVMQNHDGSTVFQTDNNEVTYPDFVYDENEVIALVKEAANSEEDTTNCELGTYDCDGCSADGDCRRQED